MAERELTDQEKEIRKGQEQFRKMDVLVEKRGTQIVLPAIPVPMTEEIAIECLQKKIERDKTVVSIFEEVDAFPLDGAHALMRTLEGIYGWVNAVPEKTFFGPKPPTMVNLEVGFQKHTQVIWGSFEVPGIVGKLKTGISNKQGRPIFCISGEVLQRHQGEVKAIADKVRDYVSQHSVYKGQAIRIHTGADGLIDTTAAPTFMDLQNVNEAELIFSEDVQTQVETNLFTPIERTAECRKHRIPLKRGLLFEGPYGTGKTLTAYVTAKKAHANGWTFVYLDRVTGLRDAIIFARQYMPAVIFSEDIDRAMSGERDVEVDDILNHIDGIDSKGCELITILTTNHVEKIEKAMLRPGRLDAVISVKPPDSLAAQKLMRLYARGLILENEDLSTAGKELAGQIPAVIREAVERSKLYAISRGVQDEEFTLKGNDIAKAAKGMKSHLELLQPKGEVVTANEQLGRAMAGVVVEAFNGTKELVFQNHKLTDELHEKIVRN